MHPQAGKILIITGIICIAAGLVVIYGGRLNFFKYLGSLPGDIKIQKDNFSFYFPLTTSILISIIVTVIYKIISRLK